MPIKQGGNAAATFRETVELARQAERLGYRRYWLVEHHNTAGVAGSATAVVIGHVAAATSTIRVGAGGIMLPNHVPLMVAEQFGTLAALPFGFAGLALGPFAGAVIGEYWAQRKLDVATRVGIGTWIGLAVGTLTKVALVFVMLGVFAISWLLG